MADIDSVWRELSTVLVFLGRPAVVRQLAAFAVCLSVSWLLSDGLRFLLGRRYRDLFVHLLSDASRQTRSAVALIVAEIGFPVLSIVLVTLVQPQLVARGWTSGLLAESVRLLEIVVVYRLIVAVFYIVLGDQRSRLYHNRFFRPLFAVILLGRMLDFGLNLDTLAEAQLFTVSEQSITLGAVVSVALVLYFLFAGASVVQHLLESVIIPHTDAERGMVNAVLTIGRYVLIIIGASMALSALGFDTTTIKFISGGLSVALAFGLQQIFANFVAGILLLFEQSLRPGDIVKVAGEMGRVERLSIRSTTLRTLDDVTVTVPNQSFLNSTLLNYTSAGTLTRISAKVTALYKGDPMDVELALVAAGRATQRVLAKPAPEVYYAPFAKGKVTAQLSVWIQEPEHMERIQSDLNLAIRNTLISRGIDIA